MKMKLKKIQNVYINFKQENNRKKKEKRKPPQKLKKATLGRH